MKNPVRGFRKGEKGCVSWAEALVLAIIGILTLITITIVLSPWDRGQPEQKQEYLNTAETIAENVPLPTYFCPLHGVACEPEEIKVEIISYSTSTGEPVFKITCWVKCPECGENKKNLYLLPSYEFEYESGPIDYYCDFGAALGISLSELTDNAVKKDWR